MEKSQLTADIEHANLPTLVPVLYQLTGDRKWLGDRYRPTRSRGMDDNDSGGFSAEVATEIKAAAVDAVLDYESGTAAAVPAPSGSALLELLEIANGESVPPEYVELAAEDMGFVAPPVRTAPPNGIDIIIIGAGISGMLAVIELRKAGFDRIVVLEKNDDVGGSWFENRYPGAGVDTPSYLYSYSFAARDWGSHFAKRDEVEQYLREVADDYDVRAAIRFNTEVVSAEYDEGAARWTVRTDDGAKLSARVLIPATGVLNRPKVPAIPGLDSFEGPVFHTAAWPAGLDVSGKRVAVIGTGASAMQVVPAIAEQVERLVVFQRSPQWIAPNDVYFSAVDAAVHRLMARVPFYARWYRARLSWNFNDRVHASLQIDPDWPHIERSVNAANDGHRKVFTRYIESELADRPDLIEKVLPDYPPFGKRMLLDNGWYAALKRPNVQLVPEAVSKVTPATVVGADGTSAEVDVVVLATGFHTNRYLYPMRITGRGGRTLAETWGPEDAHAYLGITVPDFPNMFMLCGPGTGLGHGGSFITVAECQVGYVVDLLVKMAQRNVKAVDVAPEVEAEYTRRHDDAHARMLWTHPGMTNWYRNDAGRVVATMPWRIVDYWRMTRSADLADYRCEPAAASPTTTAISS